MKFEKLKSFNKTKLIIYGTIISCIIIVITIFVSHSKYVYKDSITIMNGTINYKPYDFKILEIYVKEEDEYKETNTMPSEGYVVNEDETYCFVDYDDEEHKIKNHIYTNDKGEHIIKELPKRSKCVIYFDEALEKHEANVTVLAKLGEETINFPTKDSGKNPISVICDNDVTAKFDYNNWEVEVDALEDTEVSCTVNFEKFEPQPFNTYLTNKACQGDKATITDEEAKDCLINEEETGDETVNYRYEGSNPNNYVLFNDELWRIIGVFNVETESNGSQNLVKLIRADALDGLAWNKDGVNTWESASLQQSLNSGYLNGIDEECHIYSTTITKTCKFSDTGIKAGARDKIEGVKWNVGQTNNSKTADTVFGTENTTKTEKYYKVGLMSASDYGYAVLANSCPRDTNLSSYNKSECAGQNWLKNIGTDWTQTPLTVNFGAALYVNVSGEVSNVIYDDGHGFRPSVCLKSNIQVLGGTGTHDNPYILG